MWRIAVKSLLSHKRRLFGTVSAVVLGVAFLAGTLVLTDTMRAAFDDIFTNANAGTDVVVQGSRSLSNGPNQQSGLVPESLLPVLAAQPDVEAAAPNIQGIGQLVGSDGKPIGGDGPPTLASNWITVPSLNPYELASGSAPVASGQIVIDQGTATQANFSVGSRTTLRVPNPVPVEIVGIVTFGSANNLGGATYAGMTFEDAQKYLGVPGKVTAISLAAKPGISQEQLAVAIKPLLPQGVQAITGAQLTAEQTKAIEEGFLGFFRTFLLVFAVIALIVASFSIYNTFAVVVAQRTRESALLRALGASRSQILRSLTLESLLVGLLASVIGLFAGILLAMGLQRLMSAAGFGLPPGGLTVTVGSIITSLVVGVVVTMFASLFPALRASRIPPLAALRDVSIDRSGNSHYRAVCGVWTVIIGLIFLSTLFYNSSYQIYERTGVAAGLLFIGYLVLAPILAKPVGRFLGAPIRWVRGVSGAMAQRNATRNPRRTASTSAALMVGVCVVTLFTIFADSIKSSIDASVAGNFSGDLVMSSNNFAGAGYSPEMIGEIKQVPDVQAVAAIAQGSVFVQGRQLNLTVSDPTQLAQVIEMPAKGEPVTSLQPDQLAISQETAFRRSLTLGQKLVVGFADGTTADMTVASIFESEELIGNGVISPVVYGAHVKQFFYSTILIGTTPGSSLDQVQQQIQAISDQYSAGPVQTRDQFIESTAGQIDQLLTIVYVLLILAIIIALMGISNTLSLSIHERTRELGLLRAVGQTRGQARAMVRWESVIIALFGTLAGLLLGTVLGWALMRAVASSESVARFSFPVSQLVFVAVVGALVGVAAGIRPAFRAARLNVLQAIGAE